MAAEADGSIIIDTEIKKDNAIGDIGALQAVLKELTAAVKELTSSLANSFTNFGSNTQGATSKIDAISDSAKTATDSVESLEEQMAKINVDQGAQTEKEINVDSQISKAKDEYIDYGNTVQEFVDNYVSEMDKADKSSNEFKQQIIAAKQQIKDLENQGFYFGDEEYDSAYLKLERLKIELADYKKELKSPTDLTKSLEDQMANITVDRGFEPTYMDDIESKLYRARGEYINYGNTVQEFVEKYAAGMDTVKTKNTEVVQSTAQVTTEVKNDFKGTEQSPNMLYNAVDLVKRSMSGIPALAIEAGSKIKENFESGGRQVMNVSEKFDALKGRLDALEKQGFHFGDRIYDQSYTAFKKAESELNAYKRKLEGTDKEQKKVNDSAKKMNSSLRNTKKEADPLTKSIFKLSNMFKLMLIRMGMRAIIQSAKDGFQNLARYSNDTNAAISAVISSLTMLRNSFSVAVAPIVEIVAPILSRFITQLAEVNNWIAQTIAAMVGKDTYTKAIKVQEDYAASLTETQKAAKDAADQAKKTTFAFDTLIQAQGGNKNANEYKAPTPDQMFKTEQISNDAKALAKDVKSTLSDLFKPIKDSWEEYGPYTTNAVKTMFSSLKQLASDIGASFIKVWNDEGYGKAINDDLIVTFGNFALTVSNLATQFDKAWVNADTGTSIMRHLGDIVLEITGFFREASKSIMEWAAGLDFSPLLTSFDGLLVSLIPIVNKIGELLLWFLNEILLPLSKWAIEEAIPASLDLISAALEVLNSVIDALQPLANWLWEELLQPMGEWTGEIIIKALEGITKQLKGFSNWIKENQELIIVATAIVAGFFAAFAFTTFVNGIKSMIKVLPSLIDITRYLWLNFNAISVVLAAIVAIAVYVAAAWNKMTPSQQLATTIIAVAGAMALLVAVIAAQLKDFTALLVAGAVAAAAGFALVGIAANANSNAKKAQYPATSYSSSGYSSFSSVMPRLATGTVVPPRAGEFAAILGDNNTDTEVVSPLETMKQAFKEVIGEMGGVGGNRPITVVMELDGTKFGQAVYKANNNETQRVGVRMVTNGG